MTTATNIHAPEAPRDFTTNSDFEYWWTIEGEWVEEPNERRNGWSGVVMVRDHKTLYYVKRQFNHRCYTVRHPFGWPTVSREWHYLKRLERLGLTAPEPVFHGTRRVSGGIEAVLVTRELRDFVSLDKLSGLSSQQMSRLTDMLGDELGKLHRAKLQHSCLYDKHVMVRWDGDTPRVALIDLEKMRSRLTVGNAARHDLKQFQRRQKLISPTEWPRLEQAHRRSLSR